MLGQRVKWERRKKSDREQRLLLKASIRRRLHSESAGSKQAAVVKITTLSMHLRSKTNGPPVEMTLPVREHRKEEKEREREREEKKSNYQHKSNPRELFVFVK